MNISSTVARVATIVALAFCFFSSRTNAQIRQTKLYIDNGSGGFTTLTAPSGPGTLILPSSGTVLTTSSTNTITSLGMIGTGTWQASIIGPAYGGTGLNTSATATGNLLYTSSAGTWSALAPGASTYVLTSNGTSSAPTWQAPSGGGSGAAVAWGWINSDGTIARSYGVSGVTHSSGTGSYAIDLSSSLQSGGANAIIIASPNSGSTLPALIVPGSPGGSTYFHINTFGSNAIADQAFNFVVYDHP